MTKEETIKIMAMLGAFYSGGKNDPHTQANAWHLILGKYDYDIAEKAVLRFAENDTRDYATFPTVGKRVEAIRKETFAMDKPIKEVIASISYGRPYDYLTEEAKKLIGKDRYDEWKQIDAMEFENNAEVFANELKNNRRKLLGGA